MRPVGLASAGLLYHRVELPKGEADLVASNHWPEPLTAEPVEHHRGPVLILVEYSVDQADLPGFLTALATPLSERCRNGAYTWA